jgi:hypothetical protein
MRRCIAAARASVGANGDDFDLADTTGPVIDDLCTDKRIGESA